jgi:hypothetical protein
VAGAGHVSATGNKHFAIMNPFSGIVELKHRSRATSSDSKARKNSKLASSTPVGFFITRPFLTQLRQFENKSNNAPMRMSQGGRNSGRVVATISLEGFPSLCEPRNEDDPTVSWQGCEDRGVALLVCLSRFALRRLGQEARSSSQSQMAARITRPSRWRRSIARRSAAIAEPSARHALPCEVADNAAARTGGVPLSVE